MRLVGSRLSAWLSSLSSCSRCFNPNLCLVSELSFCQHHVSIFQWGQPSCSLEQWVSGRTGRRSNYYGFAKVLGFFRAELSGTKIGFRDFKMTAWSFRTSLTKWDPLTRPGWWDIDWNISKIAVFRQKAVFRAWFLRSVKLQWMWCFYSIQLIFSGSTDGT